MVKTDKGTEKLLEFYGKLTKVNKVIKKLDELSIYIDKKVLEKVIVEDIGQELKTRNEIIKYLLDPIIKKAKTKIDELN